MEVWWLFKILVIAAGLLAAVVLILWQHKRVSITRAGFVGAQGRAATDLQPEGVVIVNGELWQARTRDGEFVRAQTKICIVELQNHLAVVTTSE